MGRASFVYLVKNFSPRGLSHAKSVPAASLDEDNFYNIEVHGDQGQLYSERGTPARALTAVARLLDADQMIYARRVKQRRTQDVRDDRPRVRQALRGVSLGAVGAAGDI